MFKICVVCGREFETTRKKRSVCSQECGEKHYRRYQKGYQKLYRIKNRNSIVGNFNKRIASHLKASKEMINYRKECCEDNYNKLKISYYRLLIFFPLILKYNKKCKLLIEKERRIEEERQLMRTRIKKLKEYCKDNKIDYYKEYRRRYYNKKYKTDLKHQLSHKIKVAIYISLKRGSKKGRHWEDLVGYTCNRLKKYLEKTMPKNYTWQDYMEGYLHIDHIIPISVFNFIKSEHPDFKRCWALDNLQLLPARDNHKKINKLKKPFQPALRLGL